MKQFGKSMAAKCIILAVFFAGIAILISQLILRNLWRFLSFDEVFSSIFRQITHAAMHSPVLLTAAVSLLLSYISLKLWRKRRILSILCTIFMMLPLLIITLLLTSVNGIFFLDVLRSLLPLLESGVL